jgi:hypothetical protein
MNNAAEEGVNQFGEEPKSKSSNKKVFIKVISVFVVIVMASVVFFFTQQQDSIVLFLNSSRNCSFFLISSFTSFLLFSCADISAFLSIFFISSSNLD